MLRQFIKDEQGQDLIEYTLLLAFVCLATSALFVSSGGSLSGIWTSANSQLVTANTSASAETRVRGTRLRSIMTVPSVQYRR